VTEKQTTEQGTARRDLIRFRSELPESVLDAATKIEALRLSAPFDEENCTYCREVMDGEDTDTKVCRHYERFGEVFSVEHEKVRPVLTRDEEDLLEQDSQMASDAWWAEYEDNSRLSREHGIEEGYIFRNLWEALPEGYYAVPDPRSEDMTYWWRRVKGKKRPRQAFDPWPLKAEYAPVLYHKDVPDGKVLEGLTLSRNDYVHAWHKTLSWPYREAIVEAILEDPIAAQHQFADLNTRCCNCGRKLTNDLSKVYGIGPECRKDLSSEVLANYFRPEVGRG
jgi:hypothetical protein